MARISKWVPGVRAGCLTALTSNQTAALEIEFIDRNRFLNHLHGELQEADFPGVVHALNDSGQRIAGAAIENGPDQ